MRLFLKAISYLFHPLFIPIAGTVAYFLITPKYSTVEIQSGNLLPIFILTVIIPTISYLILRNLGMVKTVNLTDLRIAHTQRLEVAESREKERAATFF